MVPSGIDKLRHSLPLLLLEGLGGCATAAACAAASAAAAAAAASAARAASSAASANCCFVIFDAAAGAVGLQTAPETVGAGAASACADAGGCNCCAGPSARCRWLNCASQGFGVASISPCLRSWSCSYSPPVGSCTWPCTGGLPDCSAAAAAELAACVAALATEPATDAAATAAGCCAPVPQAVPPAGGCDSCTCSNPHKHLMYTSLLPLTCPG